MTNIHKLAKTHLPGEDYMVEHREFTDGDTRTIAKYNYGWDHDNYIQYQLWEHFMEIWVEYYEHDVRRDRRIYSIDLGERVI